MKKVEGVQASKLLELPPSDISNLADVQGGDYGNALQAASQGDHEQIVLLLLDKGAGDERGRLLEAAL